MISGEHQGQVCGGGKGKEEPLLQAVQLRVWGSRPTSAYSCLGGPTILVCQGLRGFLGHRTLNAKIRSLLCKPGHMVTLLLSPSGKHHG